MVFNPSTQPNDLDSDRIKQKALELGFHKAGIAAADEPPSQSSLTHWLTQGYHADMMWMTDPKRQDIHQLLPEVESVICLALNYYTPHDRPTDSQYAKISRYGWGRDYHRILHKKLKALTTWLTAQGDHILARYCADTAPIQDKVWAEKAGHRLDRQKQQRHHTRVWLLGFPRRGSNQPETITRSPPHSTLWNLYTLH